MKRISVACVVLMSVLGCKDDKGGSSSSSPATETPATPEPTPPVGEGTDTATDTGAQTGSPAGETGLASIAGTLLISADGGDVPAANAEVSVASHPEYTAVADAKGNFSIPNVLPGTVTLYTEATVGAGLAAGSVRAAQIRDLVVAGGETTKIPSDVRLTVPGSLSGTVSLINNPENVTLAGIDVYVPGTSFIAKTDDSGHFVISNVPAGLYDQVRLDKDGLSSTNLTDVKVTTGEDTALGTVYMSLSNGPSGRILGIVGTSEVTIGTPKQVLQSNDVSVSLKYDSRAVLMKLAHESAFVNVDWIPVAPTYAFTGATNAGATAHFADDGEKSIYVKFADQNGLESSVYRADFIIDNDAPTLGSMVLFGGRPQIAAAAFDNVPVNLDASDAGTGVKQLLLCNVSNFSGCTAWENYTTARADWILSGSSLGTKTVYAKVRDYLGRESNVLDAEIAVGDYTLLASSPGGVTLNPEQGPYYFDDAVEFGGDVTIKAGTELVYSSDNTFTVKGLLKIQGTQPNPVKLTPVNPATSSFEGFVLNEGVGGPHDIQYLKVGTSGQRQSMGDFMFIINGGTIAHVEFYAGGVAFAGANFVKKTGTLPLSVRDNKVDADVSTTSLTMVREEGAGPVEVSNNAFKLKSTDTMMGCSSAGAIQFTSGADAVLSQAEISRNTLLMDCAYNNSQTTLLFSYTAAVNLERNHFEITQGGTTYNNGIYTTKSTSVVPTVRVEHNNLILPDTPEASHFLQYGNSGGTFDVADDNFFGSSSYGNCMSSAACTVSGETYCVDEETPSVGSIDCRSSAWPRCDVAPNDPTCVGSTIAL